MALDTHEKRRSALLEGFVLPTGTLDASERRAGCWSYAGIAAGTPPVVVAVAANYHAIGRIPHAGVRYLTKRHQKRIGGF